MKQFVDKILALLTVFDALQEEHDRRAAWMVPTAAIVVAGWMYVSPTTQTIVANFGRSAVITTDEESSSPLVPETQPDQVIDFGDYLTIGDMVADSLVVGLWDDLADDTLALQLTTSDLPPASYSYEPATGALRWMLTSADSGRFAGIQIHVMNACSTAPALCPGGTHQSRTIYERFSAKWTTEGSSWTMSWPTCGSRGMKTSLFNAPGANTSERADLIFNENASSEGSPPNMALGGGDTWEGSGLLDYDTIHKTTGLDKWYKIERALSYGDSLTGAEGFYELWINGVPAHDTVRVDSLAIPAGVARWWDRTGMLDTYNCEQEMWAQPAGDTIVMLIAQHELTWLSVPGWYENKPSTQKLLRGS